VSDTTKKLAGGVKKAITAATNYWKKGKAKAEKGESAEILGHAKKRLGLADSDLLTFGVDVDLVFESSAAVGDIREDKRVTQVIDKVLAAAIIAEFTKMDTKAGSKLFEEVDGEIELKEEFHNQLTESASEAQMRQWWTKVYMNAPELLLTYLAQATSGN